jgi:hypothetical protein
LVRMTPLVRLECGVAKNFQGRSFDCAGRKKRDLLRSG